MKTSRKSFALLLLLVLGMLSSLRAEALQSGAATQRRTVLQREKRSVPAWILRALAAAGLIHCGSTGYQAAMKMWKAYQDMRSANWTNCDKYFHCRGNYEAAQYGWCGRQVAAVISNAREWTDRARSWYRTWDSGYGDSQADQEANLFGRNGGDCVQRYILDTYGTNRRCSLPPDLW